MVVGERVESKSYYLDQSSHTHDSIFICPSPNQRQALPGTIPWGVLFAYLNDFLSQARKEKEEARGET
jgi:hypothetical protein